MERRERLMATLQGEAVDRPPVCFYEINGLDEKPDDPDPYNIYSDPSWKPLLDLARDRKRLTLVGVWLLAALVAAAVAPVSMTWATAQGTKDTASNGAIMKQYAEMLKTSPKPIAVIAFLDKNIANLSSPDTDNIILDLEKILADSLEKYSDALMNFPDSDKELETAFPYVKDRAKLFAPEKAEKIRDLKLRDFVREIFASGYTFFTPEGDYSLIENYSFLKRYKKHVSAETAAYIDLMARETDNVAWDEGYIAIPWDELAGRGLQAEKFLRTYPNGRCRDRVRKVCLNYFDGYLLGGADGGTHGYDEESKTADVLLPDVKASYAKTIRKNPGTALASIVQEYMNLLKKNDYALTGPVREFRDAVPARLETLIASFGQSKPAEPSQARTKTRHETKETNKSTGQGDQGR